MGAVPQTLRAGARRARPLGPQALSELADAPALTGQSPGPAILDPAG